MNKQIQQFAREAIKKGLVKLPISNQEVFKRMYSPKNLALCIDTIVEDIPEDKLDWVLQQVENTLDLHY